MLSSQRLECAPKFLADVVRPWSSILQQRLSYSGLITPAFGCHWRHCGCRRAQPAWQECLRSQDFRAIASLNAVMFATTNGARSMLMPLLAVQRFGMSATSLGELACFITASDKSQLLATCQRSRRYPAARIQIVCNACCWGAVEGICTKIICMGAGLIFAGMACISLVVTQPAAWIADQWGRKSIIFPASVVLAASVLLMASAGAPMAD